MRKLPHTGILSLDVCSVSFILHSLIARRVRLIDALSVSTILVHLNVIFYKSKFLTYSTKTRKNMASRNTASTFQYHFVRMFIED